MSHSIMVPVSGQGLIVDPQLAVYLPGLVASGRFGCTDVYLYSHGWWTTANSAMVDYARFSVGLLEQVLDRRSAQPAAAGRSALEIGVHWPAMASDADGAAINVLEPLTFYNRAAMADAVGRYAGQALLRLVLQGAPAGRRLRFHLIGHSFGCRVVCAALAELATRTDRAVLGGHAFDLVLLQAATDADCLAAGGVYANLLDPAGGVPGLRVFRHAVGPGPCARHVVPAGVQGRPPVRPPPDRARGDRTGPRHAGICRATGRVRRPGRRGH